MLYIGSSGIEVHKSHSVIDSSKIQGFQKCPRAYFYKNVLGWRSSGNNIHLGFGNAWHDALEYLMITGEHSPANVLRAYEVFCDRWDVEFGMGYYDEHPAKTKAKALLALTSYTAKTDPIKAEYTEVGGTVPIDTDKVIHFKIDAIAQMPDGRYMVIDHKTTGRDSTSWSEQWSGTFQVHTYNWALDCLVGYDQSAGVMINGMVFTKNTQKYKRIFIKRPKHMTSAYVANARYWYSQIQWNMDMLATQSPSEDVMACFPVNNKSCNDSFPYGCQFPGLCTNISNPLQRLDDMPPGMSKKFWDPSIDDDRIKKRVAIDLGETL